MSNEMLWLVTMEAPDGPPDGGPFECEALDDAIDYMRDHRGEGPILWARSDIGLIGSSAEPAEPAPKKKRVQRRHKESPAPPEQRTQTTPAADAPKAGESNSQQGPRADGKRVAGEDGPRPCDAGPGAVSADKLAVSASVTAGASRQEDRTGEPAGQRGSAEGGPPTPAAAAKWGHTQGGQDWHLWYPDRGEAVCGSLTTAEITFEQPIEGETTVCFRCAKRERRPAAKSLSCGGTRCRDNGKTEVHDTADPSCTKVHPKRREAAR